MKTVQMTLDEGLVKEVDRVSKLLHTTRSAFTRKALREALARYNLEKLYAGMLIVTVPFLLLMGILSNYALFFTVMAFAFFHFSGQPVGNSLVAKYTDQRGRGLGFGLYFSAVFGIGSLASWFSGMIADAYSLNKIFFLLAAVIVLGFFVMLYLARSDDIKPGPGLDD